MINSNGCHSSSYKDGAARRAEFVYVAIHLRTRTTRRVAQNLSALSTMSCPIGHDNVKFDDMSRKDFYISTLPSVSILNGV